MRESSIAREGKGIKRGMLERQTSTPQGPSRSLKRDRESGMYKLVSWAACPHNL